MKVFRLLIKQYVFKNFVYDVAVLVYVQLKMWVCLFTKHVLFKVEKCSSFPEDTHYGIVIFNLQHTEFSRLVYCGSFLACVYVPSRRDT